MATLSRTRYRGGPLSDYSQSFDGLGQHYAMQQPGATQHEQLQNEAVNQQQAAGGFYRPGFEPRPAPAAPILAPPPAASVPTFGPDVRQSPTEANVLIMPPNHYGEGWSTGAITPPPDAPVLGTHNPPHAGEAGWLDIADKAGAAPIVPRGTMPPPDYRGQTFARPTGMTSDSPTLAGGGAMPTGGRPMTDPNRIIDTVARGHRNDPRTQIAVADYNRGDADRVAATEAAQAKAAWDAQVHGDTVAHQDAETRRKALAAAGLSNIGQGQPLVPTVAAQRLQAEQERNKTTDANTAAKLGISQQELAIRQAAEQRAQARADAATQRGAVQETFPGSGVYVNPGVKGAGQATMAAPPGPTMHTPSMSLPWGGQVPSLTFPGAPAQFKPMTPSMKPGEQARLDMATAKDHFSKAETIRKAIAESEAEDSKHPMDAATKSRYKVLHEKYLSELEKAAGIDHSQSGMGDVHAAEGDLEDRIKQNMKHLEGP